MYTTERKQFNALKREYCRYLDATERVDRDMIKDCLTHYIIPEVDYTNKVCLDLGGNVGGFTKIAIDNGATAVYTVECDARNYEKLSNSFANEPKATIIHAAVSGCDDETIKIYKGNSGGSHCSTSILKRSSFNEYDEVKNIHIKQLLEMYKPDIIKVDIEGAEYDIIQDIAQYYPEVIFIELHMGKVKQFAQPTIDLLTGLYPNNQVNSFEVFKNIGGYDCWFKK
jgi:FkbM family methyltransferase